MDLHSVTFLNNDYLCNYVKQRRIDRADIQDIMFDPVQKLYVLFFWR